MSNWYHSWTMFASGVLSFAILMFASSEAWGRVLACIVSLAIVWSPYLIEQIKIWRSDEDEV